MKITAEEGATYFKVEGLPPGTYTVIAGNSAGESAPASYTVPVPAPVIPNTPVVGDD